MSKEEFDARLRAYARGKRETQQIKDKVCEAILASAEGRCKDAMQDVLALLYEIVTENEVEVYHSRLKDNCEVCKGSRGGVRGNENVIEGVVMCDFCSMDRSNDVG